MANQKLSDAIQEYAGWARTNYGSGTWRNYMSTLEQFLAETGNLWVKNVTERHVDQYLTKLQTDGKKPGTVSNHVIHLKSFADFCRRRKVAPLGWDPIGYRRRQRGVPDLRYFLPQDRFADLLDAAQNQRDRAVIAVGLYLLCRQSEAIEIRISDVDLAGGWVNLEILKTRGRDVMPISSELNQELISWMSCYQRHAGHLQPDWRLLPTRERYGVPGRDGTGRLAPVPEGVLRLIPDRPPTRIDLFIKKAVGRLGLPTEGVGMHTLRRSGARARFETLAAQGYDGAVRQVQSLLHHKTTAVTERYIGLTLDVKRRDEAVRGQQMYPAATRRTPAPMHTTRLEIVR